MGSADREVRQGVRDRHYTVDENRIIAAVCAHLTDTGYVVEQRLHTTEHGIDVVARHPKSGRRILIEAKGGTSSREGSARFGKPYTQSQVFDRVAKGVFTALELRAREPDRAGSAVVLAVPDTQWFREYLGRVSALLLDAGVEVWLVNTDSAVTALGPSAS